MGEAQADFLEVTEGVDLDDGEHQGRRLKSTHNQTLLTCTQNNDYAGYKKCAGSGATTAKAAKYNYTCCTPDEVCILEKRKNMTHPKLWWNNPICTKDRKLKGMRAVRVVVIPLFGLIGGCIVAALLFKIGGSQRMMAALCAAAIGMACPLALSKMYMYYFWTVFLAILVTCFCSGSLELPGYTYKICWLLEVFQVMAIFGHYETFFVPLWSNSKATAANLLGADAFSESKCSSYFLQYFKVLPGEKLKQLANPSVEYWGLCSQEWLAFVQCMNICQGLVWMGIAIYTARFMLITRAGESKSV